MNETNKNKKIIEALKTIMAFDLEPEQVQQLILGVKNKIDINKLLGYDCIQMEIIREGLEEGIDVTPYIKRGSDFEYYQIEEIIKGLKKGLDVNLFAKEEYSWFLMAEIRKALEEGINIVEYIEKGYTSPRQIKEMIEMLREERENIEK